MEARSYSAGFDPDGASEKFCKKCGICLQKCPVMRMNRREALDEFARLRSGEQTRRVLKECTFCYNCNQYCPHGLKPVALILERVSERLKKSGKSVPDFLQYLFVGRANSSLFEDLYRMLPENEKAVLDAWETPPATSGEVMFIGCIGRETPGGIEQSSVLKTLPKYGPRLACCGEIPFRLGDFKTFIKNSQRTLKLFRGLNTKRLVCICGSCAHSFKNIWPRYLGITLPFAITSLYEWLWEKVQCRELAVKRTIKRTVALSDACYGGGLGDAFFEAVRGLHRAAGMEIIELKNNRYDNLCCGKASAVRNDFDIFEPLKVAQEKIKQVQEVKAAEVSCYCPGCITSLNGAANAVGITTRYFLEDILWALGDDIVVPYRERASLQSKLFMEKIRTSLEAKV